LIEKVADSSCCIKGKETKDGNDTDDDYSKGLAQLASLIEFSSSVYGNFARPSTKSAYENERHNSPLRKKNNLKLSFSKSDGNSFILYNPYLFSFC